MFGTIAMILRERKLTRECSRGALQLARLEVLINFTIQYPPVPGILPEGATGPGLVRWDVSELQRILTLRAYPVLRAEVWLLQFRCRGPFGRGKAYSIR